MPKKSKKKWRATVTTAQALSGACGIRRRMYYAAVLAALVLLFASVAATRHDAFRKALGLGSLVVEPAQGSAQLPLTKEYIYAGGRLVATEEPAATPTPTSAGPTPTNLVATATSSSSVSLGWTAPSSGVIGYVVERRGVSGTQEISTESASTSFNDTTPSGDYAYLYRVKAVYAGGYSDYSNSDLATTVMFTDDSLRGVTIKATHLTELRRSVAAVRALAGIGAPTWTYPDPVSTPASQRRDIYLEDVTDLRARLDEALGSLGLPAGGYPSIPTLGRRAEVYANHFEQIRQRVR